MADTLRERIAKLPRIGPWIHERELGALLDHGGDPPQHRCTSSGEALELQWVCERCGHRESAERGATTREPDGWIEAASVSSAYDWEYRLLHIAKKRDSAHTVPVFFREAPQGATGTAQTATASHLKETTDGAE